MLSLAAWISRHQQDVIDYLVEENRVLKEQLGGRRLRLTEDQRRGLAVKGKRIGRKALDRFATIVTPDTIVRWHRQLIALKWTYEGKRIGNVRIAPSKAGEGDVHCRERLSGLLKHYHRAA